MTVTHLLCKFIVIKVDAQREHVLDMCKEVVKRHTDQFVIVTLIYHGKRKWYSSCKAWAAQL